MKETSGSVTVEHNLQSRLAIKITGIVFWGLVVTGLTLAIILLQDVEEKKTEYIDALTDRFAFQIQQEIYYPDHTPLTRLKNRIDTIREQSGLQAVAMELEGETLKSGEVHDNMIENIRYVLYEKKDKSDTHLSAKITVYFPNPKLAVAEERKHLLMTMGVLFILFGFGLQKVLQYVLTAPFMRMVKTAQAISSGDNTKRFEEDRQDEFGFLSKFINKSLDFLTKQKDELTCTLEELRKSEVDLYQEKERAEVTLHSIGDAVITTDADGIIEYLNPAAEVLTGWESIELRGKQIKEVIKIYDESTQALLGCPIIECLLNEEVVEPGTDSVLLNREGNKIAISDSAAPIRDHSGKVIGAILVFQDVTETRKLTKQLAHNASHDPLTELFNRREFEIRLQQALVSAHENDMQHAICYLDLDQFKIVNDTCGHAAGDALLRQLPALLEEVIDEGDVLARLGGDEMGVLLNNCNINRAKEIAERLRKVVKEFRFTWNDKVFELGVSIGVVAITAESSNIGELMSAADVACYAAKDLGRNRVHVYELDDNELKQRHTEMQWVSRIRKALEEERFELYYQPIVPIGEDNKNELHYEILLRMHDEEGKLVLPNSFIPAAERYDLMRTIDRWVIRKTFEFLQQSKQPIYVAINLSGQSIGDENLLEYINKELVRTGTNPANVCFEVTETAAVANLVKAREFISKLKLKGCRFALDDFGSGLSSFAYLKNLEIDYLKIDGCFVKDMVDNKIDRAMVEAITRVGTVMGIYTIAEYVETKEILDELSELGVSCAQGYYLARPEPVAQWRVFEITAPVVQKVINH